MNYALGAQAVSGLYFRNYSFKSLVTCRSVGRVTDLTVGTDKIISSSVLLNVRRVNPVIQVTMDLMVTCTRLLFAVPPDLILGLRDRVLRKSKRYYRDDARYNVIRLGVQKPRFYANGIYGRNKRRDVMLISVLRRFRLNLVLYMVFLRDDLLR